MNDIFNLDFTFFTTTQIWADASAEAPQSL